MTARGGLRVVHVPYTYWPDAVGGTEVYVRSLIEELKLLGIEGAVAAPGGSGKSTIGGTEVHRWHCGTGNLASAYGEPDPQSAEAFAAILSDAKPDIVHVHARTAAVSHLLLKTAHSAGARTVFTYHTPSVTCVRGTMLYHGSTPCDGRVQPRRCTACLGERHGVPAWARGALAALPPALSRATGFTSGLGQAGKAFALPGLVDAAHKWARAMFAEAGRIVAVCDWVRDVLRVNGVPEEKIVLNRQGVADGAAPPVAPRANKETASGLRLAYFGRLHETKGIDLLPDALDRLPGAEIRIDAYAVLQGAEDPYARLLRERAARNPRFALHEAVPASEVRATMANYDAIIVPSRSMETGPLVVLEAFAAGVPIIGARRGGIAELVRDGIDGVLFPPDDADGLAAVLSALSGDIQVLAALKAGVAPPRTMRDAAGEMAGLYGALG
jgi:glycosyltransferase involved in cell wall biosynthesis